MTSKVKPPCGDYFAVDARTWHKVAAMGMNAMVAYLVLARGTGRDQATTSWSTNAIEKYTGLSRPLAKTAIETLIKDAVLEAVRKGKKPKYRLRNWSEVTGVVAAEDSDVLETAHALIWLPNSLVDGVSGNLAPPVELVRQSQNPLAMNLLISLYAVHDLRFFGGVHWRTIRQIFNRERICDLDSYTIWRFTPAGSTQIPDKEFFREFTTLTNGITSYKSFWLALDQLRDHGLVHFVAHIVEADNDQAAMVHPFGWGTGEAQEQRLAFETNREALALSKLPEGTLGGHVAAKKHLTEIAMVGLLRLLYKPHTSATAEWMSRMAEWDALADLRAEKADNYKIWSVPLQKVA